MSARVPTRRFGQSALTALRTPPSTYWISSNNTLPSSTPRRALSLNPFNRRSKPTSNANPLLFELLQRRKEKEDQEKQKLLDPKPRKGSTAPALRPVKRPAAKQGSLKDTTIFKPDYETPGWKDGLSAEEQQRLRDERKAHDERSRKRREMALAAAKLDPLPADRKRVERKLVIKSLRNRGRLTKELQLARTERQSLFKSQNLPTSVKKLTKLMNQVQGKTLEEALVQLRFSGKKVARDVYKGLQIARDEAIVARGMGLGAVSEEVDAKKREREDRKAEKNKAIGAQREELLFPDGSRRKEKSAAATVVELKNGKTKAVTDPSEIYVDQAWVGKGEHWNSLEYRARGKVNILTHRTTSFSVVLKEEKTRMRISDEIQKKRDNRKLWVALPDRPVTAQRQYCLW